MVDHDAIYAAMADAKQNMTRDLEDMIDKFGLLHVVVGLSLICEEKADHIRMNWQDKATARAWDTDAKLLDKVARQLKTDPA